MTEKISIEVEGKRISGRYVVKDGMVIVTVSDGRTTTGVIAESMLSPETLARRFCFNCTGTENDSMTSEARIEGRRRRLPGLPTGTAEQQWMLNFC